MLLVDDNPADIDLIREALGRRTQCLSVNSVNDGARALWFVHRQREYAEAPKPDLVVLDLNLPGKDGREVLRELKSDPKLSKIPVIVFTTSQAASDVLCTYELGANCYLCKPGNLADFTTVVQSMAEFWLSLAILPPKEKS